MVTHRSGGDATQAPALGDPYPRKPGRFSSHSTLIRLLGAGHGRRLLDVGCGAGHLASDLQDNDWNVFGIEPDPEMA